VFNRFPPLRTPRRCAAAVFVVGVRFPLYSCEVSGEESQLRKALISRSDESRVPDATVREPSDINSHSNGQRPEIVCTAQRAGKPPTSVPPTGGIALLIDILAREALKELMIKKSKGCKPRNLV
jgi:hypothetical protein